MIIQELESEDLGLEGAFTIIPKIFQDERGTFSKFYTREILDSKGVKPLFAEEYLSVSKKDVLRGIHYQLEPCSQAKFIRCIRGGAFAVLVDLREKSSTFGKWISVTLSEQNNKGLYSPRGCGFGFLAMQEDTAVLYKADNDYAPDKERGIIWNDTTLGIKWPQSDNYLLSEKDKKWPSFKLADKF